MTTDFYNMSSRNLGIAIGLIVGLLAGYFIYPTLNVVNTTPQTGAIEVQLQEALDAISDLEADLDAKEEVIQTKQTQINQLQGRITQLQSEINSISQVDTDAYESLQEDYDSLVDSFNEVIEQFPITTPLNVIYEQEFPHSSVVVFASNFTSTGGTHVVKTISEADSTIYIAVTSHDLSVVLWNVTHSEEQFYTEFTLPSGDFSLVFSTMLNDLAITLGKPTEIE